jgi:hypothetical protein
MFCASYLRDRTLAYRLQNKFNLKAPLLASGAGSAGIGSIGRLSAGETRTWPAGEDSVLYVRMPRTSGDEGGVPGGERGFKGDRTRASKMAELVLAIDRMAASGENDWVPKLALSCPQLSFATAGPSSESETSRPEIDAGLQATYTAAPGRPLLAAMGAGVAVEFRPESIRSAASAGGAVDIERLTQTSSTKVAAEGALRFGPPSVRPLLSGRSNVAQGGTVTSTILTSKDGALHASDS